MIYENYFECQLQENKLFWFYNWKWSVIWNSEIDKVGAKNNLPSDISLKDIQTRNFIISV